MSNDKEIIESLILGGVLGTALAALISNNKNTGTGLLAGAAILASFKANELAKKTGLPIIVEEDNALYEISPNGAKRMIKRIHRNTTSIPQEFILQ